MRRILLMGTSLFLSAVLYNSVIIPLGLITGGIHGIAGILYYAYGIKSSVSLFLLFLFLLGISYLFLGKERTLGSAFFSFCYPFLVEFTSFLNNYFPIPSSWSIRIILLSSMISSITSFMMYKSKYSNGGLPILSQILYEKNHISIAKSSFLMNLSILLIGFIFLQKNIMYSILFLGMQTIFLNCLLKKM